MPSPEEALVALRTQHQSLLEAVQTTQAPGEYLPTVNEFIDQCRQVGREVALEEDRDYLRTVLNFWGNWIYNQTRSYPDTRLETPSEEARVQQTAQLKAIQMAQIQAPPAPTTGAPDTQPITAQLPAAQAMPQWGWIAGVVMVGLVAAILLIVGLVVDGSEAGELVAVTATPEEPTRTPAPLPTETRTPAVVTPSPEPTLPVGVGGGPIDENLSSSSILAQILSPEDGATLGPDDELTLLVAYDNFQPQWTVFFTLTSVSTGVMRPVGEWYVVPPESTSGTWQVTVPVESIEPGSYLVGVLISTTPEATQAIDGARADGLTEIPEGAVPFLRLIVIVVE